MVDSDILYQHEGAGRPSPLGRTALVVAVLALGGCPTVDLGDDPADPGLCRRVSPVYFEDTLWPQYLAQPDQAKTCVGRAGCHAESDGRSALRLDNTDPIDFTRNYQIAIRFLNCGSPDASPLLTKPMSGIDAHGGGDLFGPTSPEVAVFEGWF